MKGARYKDISNKQFQIPKEPQYENAEEFMDSTIN